MEGKPKATIIDVRKYSEDAFPGWASPQSSTSTIRSEVFHSERNAKRKNKNKNSQGTESSLTTERKTLKWQSPKKSSKKASNHNRTSNNDDDGDGDDGMDLFNCGRHDCDNRGIESSFTAKRKTLKWQGPKKSSKKPPRHNKTSRNNGGGDDEVDLFNCGYQDGDNQGIDSSLRAKRKTLKWQGPKKSSKKAPHHNRTSMVGGDGDGDRDDEVESFSCNHHNGENAGKKSSFSTKRKTLKWQSPHYPVPIQSEDSIIPILLRWKDRERNMMMNQPPFRLPQIKKFCHQHGMQLGQALSLRRHHMKLLNPKKQMSELGLGNNDDIRRSAQFFEDAVEKYLRKCRIRYISEEQQKEQFYATRREGELMPPTPDFLLKEPVQLISSDLDNIKKRKRESNGISSHHDAERRNSKSCEIHWIEAKMFYGASTIPAGTNNAVGNILSTARKYVRLYGPGAMVFSEGFGQGLGSELEGLGVIVLDSYPLDLRDMQRDQRLWCGNEHGEILP